MKRMQVGGDGAAKGQLPYGGVNRAWGVTNGEGRTAFDHSPNEDHGRLTNTSWAVGDTGYSLEFNGTDSTFDLDGPPAMGNEYTVLAWARFDSFDDGDADAVLYFRNQNDIQLKTNGSGRVQFSHHDGSSAHTLSRSDTGLREGETYLYVGRWDGETVEFLIGAPTSGNVTVVDSDSASTMRTNPQFGASVGYGYFGDEYLDGRIEGIVSVGQYLSDEVLEIARQVGPRIFSSPYERGIPSLDADTYAPPETGYWDETDGRFEYKDASGTIHYWTPSGTQ